MGLDCIPLGRAKPGHEAEWTRLMEPLYGETPESAEARQRRNDISIQAYESVDAPQVGYDDAANQWGGEHWDYKSAGDTFEQMIEAQRGFNVLDLAPPCDGLPRYSHGGLYDGVDKTSLRGAFLSDCLGWIDEATLNRAWTRVMRPQDAVTYGKLLLEAARQDPPHDGSVADGRDLSIAQVRDILSVAGRWYVFWGSRGHPIWAYA